MRWFSDEDPKTVWQWLEEKGYSYDPFYEGYRNSKDFFSQWSCYRVPGDIIHYLKTGQVRNIKIFETGFFDVTPEALGYKAHKDGRCVKLKRIK